MKRIRIEVTVAAFALCACLNIPAGASRAANRHVSSFLAPPFSIPNLSPSPASSPSTTSPPTAPDAVTPLVRAMSAPLYTRLEKLSATKSLSPLDTAYIDVWELLKQDSACSRFFPSREGSLLALNMFMEHARSKDLHDARKGISMRGTYTIVNDSRSAFKFRLFKDVLINSWGAFFQNFDFNRRRQIPHIGRHPPNTRQVRALMILHELAHLMMDADGNWLIPDDGGNADLSERNSERIAAQCKPQLDRLYKNDARTLLLAHLES